VPPAAAPAPAAPAPQPGAAPNKITLPPSIVQDPQARIALQKLMFVQTHFQGIAKNANAALEAMSAAGNPDPARRKGLEKIKSDGELVWDCRQPVAVTHAPLSSAHRS
jgi:hypothetical protein